MYWFDWSLVIYLVITQDVPSGLRVLMYMAQDWKASPLMSSCHTVG